MKRTTFLLLATAWSAAVLAADVEVKEAWVRATVSGQQATGAFMTLVSKSGATVVGIASPVAGLAEVHEMRLEGGVMKMRPLPRLELEPGKPRVLGPGGYHVMLMDLKHPLAKGETIPLTLKLQARGGKAETLELKAEVRDLTASAGGHQHH
ncbi:copper chaperone PCu(A)C [Denitratisoma oestradiolicum]|uniref:Copper chaperone PCu(A)C n=1 Tax=Denitratisoma oestradiolicum TaxID=311182 RepID=A0A6S6YB29_9PROT|nr:copper chaperone PCu(A)C [Denitratisoma oestradiolicum]TWO80034.1 hypothetical protein CBW56_12020 [Denitratisoma oestradiolicum]CAB1369804.1 conserved exported protein of unknown function [Denitratisoma oestradiolicum]